MDKRIFITGPSGMGKTKLAEYIEERWLIPYVNTSASRIWPTYGFKDHKDAHRKSILDPKLGLAYQNEVLTNRVRDLREQPEFICDRSPLDNFIYFIVNLAPFVTQQETETFIEKCAKAMGIGTGFIRIPYSKEIRLDGDKRIENPYYHQLTDQIANWAIWSNEINICRVDKKLTINHWNWKLRTKIVDEWISLWP